MRSQLPAGWRERWTTGRSAYKTMLMIYRVVDPVVPPFLTHRPLTEAEFSEAQKHYVTQRFRPSQRKRGEPSARDQRIAQQIKDAIDLAERAWGWDGQRLIGSAAWASKPARERIRKRIADERIFSTGPRQQRKLLKQAWQTLPQAHRQLAGSDLMTVAMYLYEREFLWAFLWEEAKALAAYDGKTSLADIIAQSAKLAHGYPYLGLSADQIRAWLDAHPDQPELDVAERFGIKRVRSLISKYLA